MIPVILSGGSGTRLWPLSRTHYPKQFLPLTSENTMLQETWLRLEGVPALSSPIAVCNEAHRFMVAEQRRTGHVAPSVGFDRSQKTQVAQLLTELDGFLVSSSLSKLLGIAKTVGTGFKPRPALATIKVHVYLALIIAHATRH